jgi:adhesin/invasin
VTAFEVPVEFPIEFTPVTPSNIITVSNDPASAPADGATSIIVSAKVAAGLPAARRSVTFRTTLGLLLPTSIVEADGSNVARVSLVSSIAGTARITATVDGVSAETNAEFTPALPDRIVVAPDAVQLKSDGSTTIRVTLLRSPGNVSSRLVVSYSATTSTGASIGSFSRITLAEGSQSTAMFNVNTTSYVGPVTIRASVDGGASGTAVVDIVR